MSLAHDDRYQAGTVRAVLETDLITPATARALQARLAAPTGQGVFDTETRAVLVAVCDRLLPQPDRKTPIDLANIIEHELATGVGDGWRYDVMPGDVAAMEHGLAAIDGAAWAQFGSGFAALDESSCNAILVAVQNGAVAPAHWVGIEPKRFFEELLAAVTEAYYAHPLAQEEIGFLGMADAHGWDEVGLGARAAHEPVPL